MRRRHRQIANVQSLLLVTSALLLTGLAPDIAYSQENSTLQLGTVEFLNSGAPEAQEPFARGLLLMHSFQYSLAAEAFRDAQEADQNFAMAYWGEAMTYNHPVWMQQDRDAALNALHRLAPTPAERAAKAGSEREADYIRAADVLFGDGAKHERDDAYADAMARLYQTYSADEDAAAFYALALLGTAHEGREFGTYMKSAGILEQVVDEYPNHPGIAHYLIHSYDDPIHAPLGIRAARAYSKIAPDAPHAQHMTSHIFMAMGMWDEVVAANENAMRVSNKGRAARGLPPSACGHGNFWLEYGYLQQGRTHEAGLLLQQCHDRVTAAPGGDDPDPDNTPVGSYAAMLSRYVIDSGKLHVEALDWPVDLSGSPYARVTFSFASGYAAAARGDADGALAALDVLMSEDAELTAAEEGNDSQGARRQVLALELEALIRALEGDMSQAITLVRQAAAAEEAMPFEFGPPFVDKPTFELLGEILLKAGRIQDAEKAFRIALSRNPERAASIHGLSLARRSSMR